MVECKDLKKYYGDRLIIDIDRFKVYSEDRIGILGVNGVGKTTLINILSKRLEPDTGEVKVNGSYSLISQLGEPETKDISNEMASKFGISSKWDDNMSGGEKTRFKLAKAFENQSLFIFADEPTSNLDMEGIELFEKMLLEYEGALIIISHDRSLLDKICNKIVELENSSIKFYNGNYSKYRELKKDEVERAKFEYIQYSKEKKRLEGIINNTKQKAISIKGPPKRMGNSEARLHKMGGQKAKQSLEKSIKNVERRIEHLEVKEKSKEHEIIKLDILDHNKLYSKIVIEGNKINKLFDNKIIFKDADFSIYNGSKVALIGPNGCGKSTLIKMIMDEDTSIKVATGAKIGYFSQDINILDEDLSIIKNVMESSIYNETFARIFLARLLFKREEVYKKVCLLSGGERVKVSFAKLLLQDMNILILDEPTNYLDINSLEVIEDAFKDYDRTLLFVSHDREFVKNVANHIMSIENHKINIFNGSYDKYLEGTNKKLDNNSAKVEEQIFILENRLSEIIGKLSLPSKKEDIESMDREYHVILSELKKIK